MSCPSVGVRTVRIARDSDGGQQKGNVEWERPKGAKRPNKPNRHSYITHSSLHLTPQVLLIKCPSVGGRTVSAARDSDGGQQKGNVEWERPNRAKRPNRHCSIKL